MRNEPPLPYIKQVIAVGRATVATESAVDSSIQHILRLLDTSLGAGQESGLHITVTAPAMRDLRKTLDSAFDMRENLIRAHSRLGALAQNLGVTPQSAGVVWPCQPVEGDVPNGTLSVVPQAA